VTIAAAGATIGWLKALPAEGENYQRLKKTVSTRNKRSSSSSSSSSRRRRRRRRRRSMICVGWSIILELNGHYHMSLLLYHPRRWFR